MEKTVIMGTNNNKVYGAKLIQRVEDDGKVYVNIEFVSITKPSAKEKIKGKAEFWNKKTPEELIAWGQEKYGVADLYEIASKFMQDETIELDDLFKPTFINNVPLSITKIDCMPNINTEIGELFDNVLYPYSSNNTPLSKYWVDYINNNLKDITEDSENFEKYRSLLV
jgi:hypothetical protein